MATALKDKLVTLEDLLAFYNEMKGKVEMWEDVTSELGTWGTRKKLGEGVVSSSGSVTITGKIILKDWYESGSTYGWKDPAKPNTVESGKAGEGDKTKHAYMDVSAYQIYRLTSWTDDGSYPPYDVCFYRSDGSAMYMLRHSQDAHVLGGASDGVGHRGVWNNATVSSGSDVSSRAAFATGVFIVPRNATRMLIMNFAELWNQPTNDFILERQIS